MPCQFALPPLEEQRRIVEVLGSARVLSDALDVVNQEFGTWEAESFEEKKGCGSCVAK